MVAQGGGDSLGCWLLAVLGLLGCESRGSQIQVIGYPGLQRDNWDDIMDVGQESSGEWSECLAG